MNSLVAALTEEELKDRSVVHALAVRNALAQGSYTRFFRLFLEAPKMGAYVMDHFLERERVAALLVMSKASVLSSYMPLFPKADTFRSVAGTSTFRCH